MTTTKWVGGCVLLVGLTFAAPAAAQSPAGPQRVYSNKRQFRMPVHLSDGDRFALQEVQLYHKHATEPWALKEAAPPAQTHFGYGAPDDGEYWFSVVTVDKGGRKFPADVTRAAPGLVVVVDTRPPEVTLKMLPTLSGEVMLQCRFRDANLDHAKSVVECQISSSRWQVLTPLADDAELYRVPEELQGRLIRATGVDLAGNTTVREWTGRAAPEIARTRHEEAAVLGPVERRSDKAPLPERVPPANGHEPAAPGAPATPRHLLNTTRALLQYQIEDQGPSGVSKVEAWFTADEGRTWRRGGEDRNRRGPVALELPGEGLYGISLVATNGNGVGGGAPARGDAPDYWVEVDLTRPRVQLHDVTPGDGGTVTVTWSASDKNLGPEPVELLYAAHRDGPWLTMARGLRNDGSYRWTPPRDLGSGAYVRVVVTDRAGNAATADTPQPVVVDLARPKARVIGVSPGGTGPYPE